MICKICGSESKEIDKKTFSIFEKKVDVTIYRCEKGHLFAIEKVGELESYLNVIDLNKGIRIKIDNDVYVIDKEKFTDAYYDSVPFTWMIKNQSYIVNNFFVYNNLKVFHDDENIYILFRYNFLTFYKKELQNFTTEEKQLQNLASNDK